jgi:hypothetical protein
MASIPYKSSDRTTKTRIGWREHVAFSELGIPAIKAKCDTGALTSALHVENVRVIKDGKSRVKFDVPYYHDGRKLARCVAPLLGWRKIKNTGGLPEERLIIKTMLTIGHQQSYIELSLANRANMGFDLILGRSALRSLDLMVDPSRSFLAGNPRLSSAPKKESK